MPAARAALSISSRETSNVRSYLPVSPVWSTTGRSVNRDSQSSILAIVIFFRSTCSPFGPADIVDDPFGPLVLIGLTARFPAPPPAGEPPTAEPVPSVASSGEDSFSFDPSLPATRAYTGISLLELCSARWNRSSSSVRSISGTWSALAPSGSFATTSNLEVVIQSGPEIW